MASSAAPPEASSSTERILNSALHLFSRKGYDATSVREICEAAGVTKPTLYHFFGSKDGVYRALVDGTLTSFSEVLTVALESEGDTRERLRRFARSYFESGRSRPELARFVLRLIHMPATSAPATDFRRFHQRMLAALARAIERGEAGGEISPGPVGVRTLLLLGGLGQALRAHLLLGGPAPTDDVADAIVETLLCGWRPR